MEIIGDYRPCNKEQEKYCKKYCMLICCDCPHGIKVENDLQELLEEE